MPTGVYIRTEAYRDIMRKAMTGRIFTEEWKQKMRDNHVGMTGRKLSEEQRKKLSLVRLGNKNAFKNGKTILTPEHNKKWRKEYYAKNIERLRLKKRAEASARRRLGDRSRWKEVIEIIKKVYDDNIKRYGVLTCYLCEKPIVDKQDSLEHKIPLCRGGTNEYENLDVAHLSCNRKKHNLTEEEYRRRN